MSSAIFVAGMSDVQVKLTDVNELITCGICAGYLYSAVTITECLHSFCKSCMMKYISSNRLLCPVCHLQIHPTDPLVNIRSDGTLQNIVYKLLPHLEKEELKKEREFNRKNNIVPPVRIVSQSSQAKPISSPADAKNSPASSSSTNHRSSHSSSRLTDSAAEAITYNPRPVAARSIASSFKSADSAKPAAAAANRAATIDESSAAVYESESDDDDDDDDDDDIDWESSYPLKLELGGVNSEINFDNKPLKTLTHSFVTLPGRVRVENIISYLYCKLELDKTLHRVLLFLDSYLLHNTLEVAVLCKAFPSHQSDSLVTLRYIIVPRHMDWFEKNITSGNSAHKTSSVASLHGANAVSTDRNRELEQRVNDIRLSGNFTSIR